VKNGEREYPFCESVDVQRSPPVKERSSICHAMSSNEPFQRD
jgi:hypothetical protein